MKARGGFSLIELLCTVAVLAILSMLLVGHGSASAQKRARVGCEKNLEKIYLALGLYANDNQGLYPSIDNAATSETVLSLLVPRGTTMTELFICPGSGDKDLPEGEPFANARISYAYYMGRSATNADPGAALVTDWQVNDSAKMTGQALFSSDGRKPGNNHGKTGGNILQANGEIHFSVPSADRDLPLTGNVRLLNP